MSTVSTKPEMEMDQTAAIDTPQVNQPDVPWWAIHRKLYNWTLSLAHRKHSSSALFGLAFAESSVFPIPPDVLQIALTLERRERAWFYGFITLLGSVLGAILGYIIGSGLWHVTQDFFLNYVFSQANFDKVTAFYAEWDFWIVFVAAFTPIPYKVITIAAGVSGINFPMFVVASIVGRGMRFFLVASLLYWKGQAIKQFIDRYFNLVCIAFTVLLVGGFVLIKYVLAH